jgi:molybdopterin/thiamine biosynthesis adenylyltransferase
VELSNLARQVIFSIADIGSPKVEAAARHLKDRFAGVEIDTHRCELDLSNASRLIGGCDFVIDATDNPAAKFLINDACIVAQRAFVYGGVLGMQGQAMTVTPASTACLRCLFEAPPDEAEVASCREAGIVGPVAGVIGEVQAAEAAAWIRGIAPRLGGKMLTYDAGFGRLAHSDRSRGERRIRITQVAPREACGCGAWREADSRASPL